MSTSQHPPSMPRVLTKLAHRSAVLSSGRSHCVCSPQRCPISPLRDQGRDEFRLRRRPSPRGISRAAAEAAEGGAPAAVEEEDERVHLAWLHRAPAHQLDSTQVHRVGAHLPSVAISGHHQIGQQRPSSTIISHHQVGAKPRSVVRASPRRPCRPPLAPRGSCAAPPAQHGV